MRKIKLLTPILGLAALSSAVIPLASCSCNKTEETTKVVPTDMLDIVGHTLIGFKDSIDWSKYDTVYVPEDVKIVDSNAFDNMGSTITKIIFSKNIRTIRKNAFKNTSSLNTLDFSNITGSEVYYLQIEQSSFKELNGQGKVLFNSSLSSEAKVALQNKLINAGVPGSWMVQETTGHISCETKQVATDNGNGQFAFKLTKALGVSDDITCTITIKSKSDGVVVSYNNNVTVEELDAYVAVTLANSKGLKQNDNVEFNLSFEYHKNGNIIPEWVETVSDLKLIRYKEDPEPVVVHTVTFDTGVGGPEVKPQHIVDGDSTTIPNTPLKENCHFVGWYNEPDFKTKFDFWQPVKSDLTVYGKFEQATTTGLKYAYSVEKNSYCLIYDDPNLTGEVIIPDCVNGKQGLLKVTSIGNADGGYNAQFVNSKITSLVLPDAISYILNGSICNCPNLKRVNSDTDGEFNIPKKMTNISRNLFSNCPNLTHLYFNENINTIKEGVASNCPYLVTTTKDSNGITYYWSRNEETNSINKYFAAVKCDDETISSIELNDECRIIASDIFYYYSNLETVKISKNVKSISPYAFFYCEKLKTVYYDNLVEGTLLLPESTTNIGASAFQCCKFDTIDLRQSNVQYIGDSAFHTNKVLQNVYFNDTLEIIDVEAFAAQNAEKTINKITLPKNLKTFYQNSFRRNIPVGEIENNSDYIVKDGAMWYGLDANKNKITAMLIDDLTQTTVQLPSTITKIQSNCFEQSKISSIVLPDSLKIIEFGGLKDCKSLQTIEFPSSLEYIGGNAFYTCEKLQSFTFKNNTSNLKYMGPSCFASCASLESFVIPSSVIKIGNAAFDESLKNLTSSPFEDKTSSWHVLELFNWEDYTGVEDNTFVPSDDNLDKIEKYFIEHYTEDYDDYSYEWYKN